MLPRLQCYPKEVITAAVANSSCVLGKGGQGLVVLAELDGQKVAIKHPRPGASLSYTGDATALTVVHAIPSPYILKPMGFALVEREKKSGECTEWRAGVCVCVCACVCVCVCVCVRGGGRACGSYGAARWSGWRCVFVCESPTGEPSSTTLDWHWFIALSCLLCGPTLRCAAPLCRREA